MVPQTVPSAEANDKPGEDLDKTDDKDRPRPEDVQSSEMRRGTEIVEYPVDGPATPVEVRWRKTSKETFRVKITKKETPPERPIGQRLQSKQTDAASDSMSGSATKSTLDVLGEEIENRPLGEVEGTIFSQRKSGWFEKDLWKVPVIQVVCTKEMQEKP